MLRSYLYAPGSRPTLMAKALASDADAVILDLEDAVAPAMKADARNAVAELLTTAGPRPRIHVRVNRAREGFDHDDVRAVVKPALAALRLPKVESIDELVALSELLDELEAATGLQAGHVRLYPTVESAGGVFAARALAGAPRVARLAFGASDFLADIAAPGTSDGPATETARGILVLASRVAGVGAPVDSVHTRLDDDAGLRRSAMHARALGFYGKSVIHPAQLPIVHDVFTPTTEEISQARRLVAEADAAARAGAAATRVGGQFVDPAVAARARAVLERAKEAHVNDER